MFEGLISLLYLSGDFSSGATEKTPLWLSYAVWFLYFFSLVSVDASVVPVLCLLRVAVFVLFFFKLGSSSHALCLSLHHVKTQSTADLSLFIDFVIVGLILYSSMVKAEQHRVLFLLLRFTKLSSLLLFPSCI